MALIATLSGDYNNAAWANGVGFTPNSSDTTRLEVVGSASLNLSNTVANWDLTGSVFSWKFQKIPFSNTAGGPAMTVSLELRDNGTASTGYRILRSVAGSWQFQKAGTIVGSAWTDDVARANPYCRVRESAGTTFFEFSPDGSTWSQPNGAMSTANYTTITAIKPRWQPSAVADSGRLQIQQTNGVAAPTAITGDSTIMLVGQSVTAAAAALNTSPAVVTGTATGDLSILIVEVKASTAGAAPTITTPSGWTIIGSVTNNGTLVAGTDTGSNTIGMYQRTGTYTAPTISTTGADSMASGIVVYRSSKVTAGGTWDVSQSTTGSDTTSGANIATTGAAGIAVSVGDMVLAAVAISGDVGTTSAYTIGGMSGATLLQPETPIERDVTLGTDSRLIVTTDWVTAGSSSSAPTYALTNSSSTTGHSMFLRVRDVAAPSSARFQGVTNVNRPAVVRASTW